MPLYDYRCRACGEMFELRRPMTESDAPAPCPRGHRDTVKMLPLVAVSGRASESTAATAGGGGGACCGGACGCG